MAADPVYLRRREAAAYLKRKYGVGSAGDLAFQCSKGTGPKIVYNGRFPLYTEEWLDEWALSRISAPTTTTRKTARRMGRPRKDRKDDGRPTP